MPDLNPVKYEMVKGCHLEVSKGPAELGGCRVFIAKRCTGGVQRRMPEGHVYRPTIHTEWFQTAEECDREYRRINRKC